MYHYVRTSAERIVQIFTGEFQFLITFSFVFFLLEHSKFLSEATFKKYEHQISKTRSKDKRRKHFFSQENIKMTKSLESPKIFQHKIWFEI